MPHFQVEVNRIGYASLTFVFEAATEEEAKQMALEEAPNCLFSEHNSDYEVEYADDISCEYCQGTGKIPGGLGRMVAVECPECDGQGCVEI